MGRIGAQLSGFELRLLNSLAQSNAAAATNSLRLATGNKINSPRDDPSAFLHLSNLQTELNNVKSTVKQVNAAATVGAKAQLTLDQVRTQLDAIRATLLTDVTQSLSGSARTTAQASIDIALNTINSLASTQSNGRGLVDGSADFRTSGALDTQITDVRVRSVEGTSPAISGSVVSAASQASLLYTGASGNTTAAATFSLTGQRGSTTVTVTNGQALTDVRDSINLYSHDTGITAAVSGDELTFTTVDAGTDATIAVSVSSGTFAVTGGNNDGTATGTNLVAEINGKLISGNTAAQAASLTHTELSGSLTSNADFRLTGNTGFFDFSFANSTSLTDVRDAVNVQNASTGVTATVSADGFDLIFTSDTQGASATVGVEVTDGALSVTASSASTVTSLVPAQRGELVHTTTDGTIANNATIRITGLTGVNNSDISVTAGELLSSVVVKINAEQVNTGVAAEIVGDQLLVYSIETGDDAFAQIEVQSGTFVFTGGDGSGQNFGVDPVTTVVGADAVTNLSTVDGNTVTFNHNGLHAEIDFAAGFTGSFSTVTISDDTTLKFALSSSVYDITTLGIGGVQTAQLGGISGTLDQLVAGGTLAGLSTNTSQAIRVVDEALAELSLIEAVVDGFADYSVASSAALYAGFESTLEDSIANINEVDEEAEALLLAKNQALASNVLSSLSVLADQRKGILALIQQIAGL